MDAQHQKAKEQQDKLKDLSKRDLPKNVQKSIKQKQSGLNKPFSK